jgi:hypothetical protein
MTVRAGGFGGPCLTPAAKTVTTTATCAGGFVTVTAITPPGASSGRLLLSDGRAITSPVYSVPHGGSRMSGFFFQVVRGPKPVPLSVTVSDRGGHATATARFPRIVDCTANPIHYLPGGVQTLVRGRSSRGVRFEIVGLRYRFLGRVYFCLQPTSFVSRPYVPSSGIGPGASSSQSCPDRQPGPVASDIFVSCIPAPLELVYGLLRDAHDQIELRSGGKRIATKRAPIPTALHAHGQLFYAETQPGPVMIRARAPLGATPLQTYPVPPNPCASGAVGVGVRPQSPSATHKR